MRAAYIPTGARAVGAGTPLTFCLGTARSGARWTAGTPAITLYVGRTGNRHTRRREKLSQRGAIGDSAAAAITSEGRTVGPPCAAWRRRRLRPSLCVSGRPPAPLPFLLQGAPAGARRAGRAPRRFGRARERVVVRAGNTSSKRNRPKKKKKCFPLGPTAAARAGAGLCRRNGGVAAARARESGVRACVRAP